MTRRKKPTTIIKTFISGSLIFAVSSTVLHAADLLKPGCAA